MNTDLLLVIGILLVGLSIPSLLAAFSESRQPRAAMTMLLIGGILIVVALTQTPRGYTFAEIPDVVLRVIGSLVN